MCLAATNACVPIVAARPTRRLPFCFAPFLFAIRRAHTHKKRVGGLGHPCLGYIYIYMATRLVSVLGQRGGMMEEEIVGARKRFWGKL